MDNSGWISMFGEFVGKRIMVVLICVVIGMIGTYYASEIFLTEKEFQYEKNAIMMKIETTSKDIKVEVLDFRKDSIEQKIWELENTLDKDPFNNKTLTRLSSLKEDLNTIKLDIKNICSLK